MGDNSFRITISLVLLSILSVLIYVLLTADEPTTAPQQPSAEAVKVAVINLPDPAPEPEPEPAIDYPNLYEDAIYAAKAIFGEGSYLAPIEKAAIVWCACNRTDSESTLFPDTFSAVITQRKQFQGYRPDNPVTEENLALAIDVLTRWAMEKAGAENVGRVLPADYLYFMGDLKHNYYTTEYRGTDYWDWSIPNPYEEIE